MSEERGEEWWEALERLEHHLGRIEKRLNGHLMAERICYGKDTLGLVRILRGALGDAEYERLAKDAGEVGLWMAARPERPEPDPEPATKTPRPPSFAKRAPEPADPGDLAASLDAAPSRSRPAPPDPEEVLHFVEEAGTWVQPEAVAKRFGVSEEKARMVLGALAKRGALESAGKRGWGFRAVESKNGPK